MRLQEKIELLSRVGTNLDVRHRITTWGGGGVEGSTAVPNGYPMPSGECQNIGAVNSLDSKKRGRSTSK